MIVEHLSLVDFRNYAVADVALRPGPNVFVGRNGQGKTNLAEAIAFLATLGSHRVSTDAPRCATGRMRPSSVPACAWGTARAARGTAEPAGCEQGAGQRRPGQEHGTAALRAGRAVRAGGPPDRPRRPFLTPAVHGSAARAALAPLLRRALRLRSRAQAAHRAAQIGQGTWNPRRPALDARRVG